MEASSFSRFVTAKFVELQDALTSEHDHEVDGLREKLASLQAELSDLKSRSGLEEPLRAEIKDLRAQKEQACNEVLELKAKIQEAKDGSTGDVAAFKAQLEDLRKERDELKERAQGKAAATPSEMQALRAEILELKEAQLSEMRLSAEEVERLKGQIRDLEASRSPRTRVPQADLPEEAEAVKAEIEATKQAKQQALEEAEALKASAAKRGADAQMERDQKRDSDHANDATDAPGAAEGNADGGEAPKPGASKRRGGAFSAARGGAFSTQTKAEAPEPAKEDDAPAKSDAAGERASSDVPENESARAGRESSETPESAEKQLDPATRSEEPKPAKAEEEPAEPLERPFEALHGFAGAVFGEALQKDLGDRGVNDMLEQLGKVVPPPPPNAAFHVGQVCEVIGTIMRRDESLESPKVCRLEPGTRIEVKEIGAGPTGKRIKVVAQSGTALKGMMGWISVVSGEGVALLTPVEGDSSGGFIGDLIGSIALGEDDLPSKKSEKDGDDAAPVASSNAPVESIDDILGRLDLQESEPQKEETPAPKKPPRRSAFAGYAK